MVPMLFSMQAVRGDLSTLQRSLLKSAANTSCAMQAVLGIPGDIPCTWIIIRAAGAPGSRLLRCRLLCGRLLRGRLLHGRRALLWGHLLGSALLDKLLHLRIPNEYSQQN